MNNLEVKNIQKSFGETKALAGVSFEVAEGEIMAVLGPSGCGKSTLLSVIAGLETPDQGSVLWGGQDLAGIPAHKRNFGLMFQDYALFPHKNVFDNVSFGLQMDGVGKDVIASTVQETLDMTGLSGFEKRDVSRLSGGEQQRVALARSLAPHPCLLMLDEPLGSLDKALRERLLDDLRAILRDTGQTILYVTHDQEEAFSLADRVVVMDAGTVAQTGTPQDIYCYPESVFVAKFMGLTNIFQGEAVSALSTEIVTPVGRFPVEEEVTGTVEVLIRSDAARLEGEGSPINGTVESLAFRGGWTKLSIRVGEELLVFDFDSDSPLPEVGQPVTVWIDLKKGLQIFRGTPKTHRP
ncbi:MAG: ABC transporter ATP-binding protein [Anaerolineales bacterium]|jgi:ABC-type Fe3+/spermidine/putrescine transport system ATPase subunit